jgi:deazaflavin-dependent oxidoreductase (nitroreductase family)
MSLEAVAGATEGVLVTTGRVSGRPREVTLWFAVDDGRIVMLAGGGRTADWVRNLEADPGVELRANGAAVRGTARIVEGEPDDPLVRDAIAAKYGTTGLTSWLRTSLPVVIDPDAAAPDG